MTPGAFNPGVFSLIRQISETVVLPIAGLLLTFVMTWELIQLIVERNNLHEIDTWIFFKWVFKTMVAVLILSNTFNIVMGIFDVAQHVVNSAAGVIAGSTDVTPGMLDTLRAQLEAMNIGSLLGLWFQSMIVNIIVVALNIVVFVIVYGRIIEIYILTSLAPLPMATLTNREMGGMGQNYIKSLLAVGFQGLLIMVCVAIYAVLVQSIATRKTRLTQTKKIKTPPRSVKRKSIVPRTAQQTIPYREMLQDGICKVRDGYYTKTIEYEDINYSVASNDDQAAIFEGYCGFLNYFDSALPFQMSFINHRARPGKRYKVNIPMQSDNYDSIRKEFTNMLKGQIAKSNNGIVRSKYITFGLPAMSADDARPRLDRVETDITGNFKKLGVQAKVLNGLERLEVLHGQLHPGGRERFLFSWADIAQTGLSTKDFIAPTSFEFQTRIPDMMSIAITLAISATTRMDDLSLSST